VLSIRGKLFSKNERSKSILYRLFIYKTPSWTEIETQISEMQKLWQILWIWSFFVNDEKTTNAKKEFF